MSAAKEIAGWVADAVGVHGAHVAPLGAAGLSREMWTVTGPGLDAIVKRDTGRGPLSGTAFTPGREAAALRAVAATDVAAPRVLAVSDDDRMFLMERLPGEADVAPVAQPQLRDSLLANAAALHALGPVTLGLSEPSTVHAAVLANLADFRCAYDGLSITTELVESAFAWAAVHAPAEHSEPVLLHGDLGPGNFLHHDGAITGLVDWELWHLGDPMDDLASLWFRKCVLRQDQDLAEWFEAYSKASGTPLDAEKLRYFRAVTLLRVVIAVLVMQQNDPDRHEGVAGMMLPLLGLALDAAAGGSAAGLPPI